MFKIPIVAMPTGKTGLAALASQHMSSITKDSGGGKFILPSLKVGGNASTETAAPPKFIIPKFNTGLSGSGSGKTTEPPTSLLKNLKIGEEKSPISTAKIDLTAAIVTGPRPDLEPKEPEQAIEQFTPRFIPCVIVEKTMQNVSGMIYCQLDASGVLNEKIKIKASRATLSQLGRVICRRYRVNTRPNVAHEFVKRIEAPTPFAFDKPSPDDIILAQLRRRHNRVEPVDSG